MDKIKLLLIILLMSFQVSMVSAQSNGRASYYSNALHGRKMSNGERYNKNDFTCAHRTLPFGTRLRVTNLRNGKQVIVRVTDRGPFVRSRIIDLSYAAARALGSISSGVATVKIEVLRKETKVPYIDENKPLEVEEVVYGQAGVCYEFIPEWEKVPEEAPVNIQRKVNTHLNRRAVTTTPTHTTKPNKQPKKSSPAPTVATPPKNTTTKDKQEEGESSSWTDFFGKVKNGISGLFE